VAVYYSNGLPVAKPRQREAHPDPGRTGSAMANSFLPLEISYDFLFASRPPVFSCMRHCPHITIFLNTVRVK
jgi:hypothetical protein